MQLAPTTLRNWVTLSFWILVILDCGGLRGEGSQGALGNAWWGAGKGGSGEREFLGEERNARASYYLRSATHQSLNNQLTLLKV